MDGVVVNSVVVRVAVAGKGVGVSVKVGSRVAVAVLLGISSVGVVLARGASVRDRLVGVSTLIPLAPNVSATAVGMNSASRGVDAPGPVKWLQPASSARARMMVKVRVADFIEDSAPVVVKAGVFPGLFVGYGSANWWNSLKTPKCLVYRL
jgi:hypothetical protein